MAQDLATIPGGFVIAAVAAVLVALVWRARGARVALAGAAMAGGTIARGASEDAEAVARGREVYIAEGCMHCHSQYVRPGVALDIERWGPATRLSEALRAAPPLLGNRRQGPDLANVGNRRTAEWNRLHLISPRLVSPGSRMPGYAYLFAGDDSRGDALVAYLMSLGAETQAERQTEIATWTPRREEPLAPEKSRALFLRLCANCHGEAGQGDGPMAARLSLRPPDWAQAPWRHVLPDAGVEVALSRIIKFGLPGLPMAGHEYLTDGEVVGLARHVRTLHNQSHGGCSAVPPP
jgi:cytochrome c oxidase cbb3-type subunit 2